MAGKLYLHIRWDETREKNGSQAGDRGVYGVEIREGDAVTLICHLKKTTVTKCTEDGVTLDIPDKGEYRIGLNETARIVYSDGHQVAGDWVDERLTYEIKLSDLSLDEYEASLPEFEIRDGVLKKVRLKGDTAIVPEGVVAIGHKAFSGTKLKTAVLPSTLKKIDSFAFADCSRLKRIELPEGLEELGFCSFAYTGIEEIAFPKSLQRIDNAAFKNTPFFEKTKNERFVILAGRFLCLYRGYDETVEVPDGVEVICSGAFTSRDPDDGYRFCTPKRIVLPDSVKRIDGDAFRYLYGLREINLREDLDVAPSAFERSGYEAKFEAFRAARKQK